MPLVTMARYPQDHTGDDSVVRVGPSRVSHGRSSGASVLLRYLKMH